VTYRTTSESNSAKLIERIALILSKRLERSELVAAIFAELMQTSGASHVVLWRRDPVRSSLYRSELSSCQLNKDEEFDASLFAFWKGWQSGDAAPLVLDGLELDSLAGRSTRASDSAGDGDRQPPATLASCWSRQNLILPLAFKNGLPGAILSLHLAGSSMHKDALFSLPLAQVLANSLVAEVRESQESVSQLLAELWLERSLRLVLTRVNARVDRDFVLQSAVDTLGSILKVSSCLVLRNYGGATRVTHEYVNPELSPLGLGCNCLIPASVASQMCERTTIYEEALKGKTDEEDGGAAESYPESSTHSLAGTAIVINTESYGALVIQSDSPRKWQRQELKLLEGAAAAVSMALRNAELYQEAREQVFNLNLLTNLSRQLSSAVESLFKHPTRPESVEESSPEEMMTPLSSRELEVLRLIASGLSNREIAQRLFLTESTVELHASRIRKKLKLKSRTALVKYACDNRLV
jgi:DNA-binding CsgD family transcriptional regulator